MMRRVIHDPDHPAYGDDAEGDEIMKIPVWFTTEGEILCRDCADDAKAAGHPWLRIAHIAPRLVECAWCHQTITKESKR